MKELFIKIGKSVVIIALTTLLALALDAAGLRVENILMLYTIAILIVITETKQFVFGASSAFVCVMVFNFFFTEPRFTFRVNDPNYFVSFGIFFVLAFIASTLTTRLNHQILLSQQNEERTSKLYKISNGYLNITGSTNIISYSEKSLSALIGKTCRLYVKTDHYEFTDSAVLWCYQNALPCGFGETHFSDLKYKYLPITSGRKTLGAVSVEISGNELSKDELLYINTMLSQITIALEHDFLTRAEENNRFHIEKEQLKSTLLRSISKDLRMPLSTIADNAEFLTDSIDKLDMETIKSMLANIKNDASWLAGLVENLMHMTRLQDGNSNRQKEVVNDIIDEAVKQVSKRLCGHTLKVHKPEETLLVPMDAPSIIQILVILLDNCIRQNKESSEINLRAYTDSDTLLFELSGIGIKTELLNKIFDNNISAVENDDAHTDPILELSIVKAILEVHGGEIMVENRKDGISAAFKFSLPLA